MSKIFLALLLVVELTVCFAKICASDDPGVVVVTPGAYYSHTGGLVCYVIKDIPPFKTLSIRHESVQGIHVGKTQTDTNDNEDLWLENVVNIQVLLDSGDYVVAANGNIGFSVSDPPTLLLEQPEYSQMYNCTTYECLRAVGGLYYRYQMPYPQSLVVSLFGANCTLSLFNANISLERGELHVSLIQSAAGLEVIRKELRDFEGDWILELGLGSANSVGADKHPSLPDHRTGKVGFCGLSIAERYTVAFLNDSWSTPIREIGPDDWNFFFTTAPQGKAVWVSLTDPARSGSSRLFLSERRLPNTYHYDYAGQQQHGLIDVTTYSCSRASCHWGIGVYDSHRSSYSLSVRFVEEDSYRHSGLVIAIGCALGLVGVLTVGAAAFACYRRRTLRTSRLEEPAYGRVVEDSRENSLDAEEGV
mmetsp:Transcript_30911/g.77623  ORF Transcript_30911/g.77623 Transcript_30911/m.77623 type:complete len:418 (+) Transcript_30911:1-1254(+)|eukprot:CAMPEP_0177658684 /NCGR_PEP_ID=MMETSP0447-20121125/16971_1 /TAXON_ID=0 /ORGANISM="Stygamoeba regulata, Strain BSH-02190019" /LENGTH=417 /DNA_ID=CAMNT_0019163365 /DNA_START=91 /DNA_END=1344 /DNA_ORIENTATION=+